ncbi:MAG: DNA primase [Pseudomonadota bacterium]
MAGRIPQSFIDDLVARADIVEVLGSRIELRKGGREYKALCPFHNEKSPSFTVSPDKGFYHCFGCGAHGTALGFLMEHDHLSFPEAVEELAGMMGVEVPREAGNFQRDTRIDQLHTLMDAVAQAYADILRDTPEAVEYLKQRGIDGQTAREFRIGWAPDAWDTVLKRFGGDHERVELLAAAGLVIPRDTGGHYDRFRGRVMFPIRDARGRTVGFGGRVIGNGEPKYLNSPETVLFHKGRELYGLYEARQKLRDIDRLVVVEGYMDVVGLARNGIRFAVATLGTATTGDHLDRLFRLTNEVVFSFDGDRAGRKAAWRALENALPKITDGRALRFAFMPDGQDPDSLVAKEGSGAFERVLDAALPLSDFMIGELSAQVDAESAEGRAQLAELARPLVAQLPDGVYRELVIDALAEAVSLGPAKLRSMLGDAPTARRRGERQARRSMGQRATPMRRAITLLLHEPAAALDFDLELLAGLERPGADILKRLVADVQARPGVSPAVLLEQWRGDPNFGHLQKLAAAALPEDVQIDTAAELRGVHGQLVEMARADRVEQLRDLAVERRLTAGEGDELRQLLAAKAQRDKTADSP